MLRNKLTVSVSLPVANAAMSRIDGFLSRLPAVQEPTIITTLRVHVVTVQDIADAIASLSQQVRSLIYSGGGIRAYYVGDSMFRMESAHDGAGNLKDGAVIYTHVVFERVDGSRYAPQDNGDDSWLRRDDSGAISGESTGRHQYPAPYTEDV